MLKSQRRDAGLIRLDIVLTFGFLRARSPLIRPQSVPENWFQPMQARLQIAPREGEVFLIGKDRTVLGSDRESDFRLRGGGISPRHAEIVRDGPRFVLRDLRSRTGTFVNGQPVDERELVNGDQIRLGRQSAEWVFTHPRVAVGHPVSGSLRGMAALLEKLRVLDSASVLDDVLIRVLDAAIELTKAERAFVLLPDAQGRLERIRGRAPGCVTLEGPGLEIGRVIPERVFRTGQAEQLADLTEPTVGEAHRRTRNLGIRAVICVPLAVIRLTGGDGQREGHERVIGVLYLDSARSRVQMLARPTLEALESLAAEASVTIDNADLYRQAIAARETEEDMRRAREVQRALLPQKTVETSAFQAAGISLACRAIGGDFLDYFQFPDGRLGVAVGDVAGKGPPAAMLASYLQGLMTASVGNGESPEIVLAAVSRMLLRHALDWRFATFFYAVASPRDLTWCNAGHPPGALLRRDGSVERLESGGFPLGAFEDAPYQRGRIDLEPGDTLVVFSDGVTEAANHESDAFGDQRLMDCLCRYGKAGEPSRLVDQILQDIAAFTSGEAQSDDITVLALRRRAAPDEIAP